MNEGSAAEAIRNHRNARSSSAEEVAKSFVAPPQYWQIAQSGNTVIVGPRGSGKTTLLKMLRGPTLELWKHPDANRARELVTYSGVLVPADKSWSGQIESYDSFDDALRTNLGIACYTLHTLRALSQCAAHRITRTNAEPPHDRVEIDRSQESRIATETWRGWGLPEPAGSFLGLSEAVGSLLEDLGKVAKRASRLNDHAALVEHPALDLDLVGAAIPFIERFNNAAAQPDHVWSLLIDEIEFLPPGINTTILSSMRGSDPRLTQKVSFAPYTQPASQPGAFGAWIGHDVEEVDLSFNDKEDGYPFARALIEKEIEMSGFEMSTADLLGPPGFFETKPHKEAYAPGTQNATAIADLAEADPSFKEWLSERQIDPNEDLSATKGVKRASTLRKPIAIILLRNAYLHSVRGRLQRRSRKAPHTYTGELSAFAICENNPRRLKTLASKLLSAWQSTDGEKITESVRAEAIDEITGRFAFHLRAIAVNEKTPTNVLPALLIERIGRYFEERVLGQNFDPEPPLSFEVSSRDRSDPFLDQILSQLVFYGAVVRITDDRYRLAHTFAPIYKLPLRSGRPIALNSILNSDPPQQMEIAAGEEK